MIISTIKESWIRDNKLRTFSALCGWSATDSLYFSFAALATIGIFEGTSVPPSPVGAAAAPSSGSQALFVTACTLYLLFGMALVAMCFNLVILDRTYAAMQRQGEAES